MTDVYLIDQDYLIRYSWINGTVDEDFLKPAIRLAQMKRVRFYLGKCLYDKLISLVQNQDAGDATSINDASNSAYKTLLDDYLRDVVMYWTLVELYPYLVRKIDNSNIFRRVSSNSQPISSEELADMVKNERSTAQHFTDQMIKYLCDLDDGNQIPEWETCDSPLANSHRSELPYIDGLDVV